MQLKVYSKDNFEEWNSFIAESKNTTFLLDRNYMDYHSDRFTDHSLMFYDEKEALLAVFPCNINSNIAYSHQGLTYGGLITTTKIKTSQMLEIFELIISHFKNLSVAKIIYKTIPDIYHSYPAQEDLYALFRFNAVLVRRDVSSCVDIASKLPFNKGKKYNVSKAKKMGLVVRLSTNFAEFMQIEAELLQTKYGTKPVHTTEEINLLASKFPNNIKLYCSYLQDTLVAGVIVYESKNVAHAQYMASTESGKEIGALDIVIKTLIDDVYKNKKYFDFGISTENQGKVLNEGLISQKEGFGGRAITYDTYELSI